MGFSLGVSLVHCYMYILRMKVILSQNSDINVLKVVHKQKIGYCKSLNIPTTNIFDNMHDILVCPNASTIKDYKNYQYFVAKSRKW